MERKIKAAFDSVHAEASLKEETKNRIAEKTGALKKTRREFPAGGGFGSLFCGIAARRGGVFYLHNAGRRNQLRH